MATAAVAQHRCPLVPVRGNEQHRAIRVCAVSNSIGTLALDARFANGGDQDIRVGQVIRPVMPIVRVQAC